MIVIARRREAGRDASLEEGESERGGCVRFEDRRDIRPILQRGCSWRIKPDALRAYVKKL